MPQPTKAQKLLQKAEAALIAAIEVYNKPDFRYREENFSILALNAWELLLKARLLHLYANDSKCLYVYESRSTKKGAPAKKRFLRRNRSGNCQTLSFGQTIIALEKKASAPSTAIRRNLDALTEIRDNAIHFIAAGPLLAKQVLEVGTAAIANFVRQAREWFNHDLSKYHLYLMPLGFIAPQNADSVVVTSDEAQVVQYIASLMQADNTEADSNYHVALTVQLKMKRSMAGDAAKVVITDDPNATPVFLSEEDFKRNFPWDYAELTKQLQKRYSDFKITLKYHTIRRPLTKEAKYCMSRFLDPGNPKSAKKDFFSQNILNEFDKHYTRV